MAEWSRLKDDVFAILKDSSKDLWEEEDTDFLHEIAEDIAEQKVRATNAKTHAERAAAETNLRFLAADVQGRVAEKQLKLTQKGKEAFIRSLEVVIRTVAIPALTALS